MTTPMIYKTILGVIVIAAAAAVMSRGGGAAAELGQDAATTPGPHGIGVLHAQRFELELPTKHMWRQGWPLYDSGWLLVLNVDPAMVTPRQTLEPVLYVGDQTAWRVNFGAQSGHVVAVVPGDFALSGAPIFFGDLALPERISSADITRELAAARADGVLPPTGAQVSAVLHDPVRLPDVQALEALAIDLVEKHSPQEQDWVRSMRVPSVR